VVSIGENIRSIRVLRELTQEKLAEMAKLSRSSIVNFETGKRAPRVDDLESIAKALGVEVSIFFQENPTQPRREETQAGETETI
jgi:transcriptional regulator with XRE-family HTH domain